MEKKKYDYTKIAFFTIVTLLVIIIAIAVVNNNIERSTYYELYEGVESFESVEKKYKETALVKMTHINIMMSNYLLEHLILMVIMVVVTVSDIMMKMGNIKKIMI